MKKRCLLVVLLLMQSAPAIAQEPLRKASSKKTSSIKRKFSTDGGRHWNVSNSGMPETAVTHIILDPASPLGRRTLYACAFGRGVYKSTDNGRTWALKNNGLEQKQPFAWLQPRGPSVFT